MAQSASGRGRGRDRGQRRGQHSGGNAEEGRFSAGASAEAGRLSADAPVFRVGAYFCKRIQSDVFYQTALVPLRNKVTGKVLTGRIMLDTACHDSYMVESL